CQQNNGDPSTF
nr:immunoglobulin light chain junction region [Macaca mulatta]